MKRQDIIVFSNDWFEYHQSKLLRFANSRFGRYVLRIHGQRSKVGKRAITKIEPNAISWREDDGQMSTEYRTHAKYAKRLYHAFKPFWHLLHFWDIVFANQLHYALNVGFDTLTVYPDANPETNTVDGIVSRAPGAAEAFATIRAGAGNSASDSATSGTIWYLFASSTSNTYAQMSRSKFLFNTSSLYSSDSVTNTVFSLYCTAKQDGLGMGSSTKGDAVVTNVTTASNTVLATSDFNVATFNSTVQFTRKDYDDFTIGAYNDFSSTTYAPTKGGITKLGIRSGSDYDNSAPTWASLQASAVSAYFADNTGTSQDPTLTVTYTPSLVIYGITGNPYADGKLRSKTGAGAWADVSTADLRFRTYSAEGATTVAQNSLDPSQIIRNALDYFQTQGGTITYDAASIDNTSTTVSYTFVTQSILEVINKALELAPFGWYWYIDPATNRLHFHEKNVIADHSLIMRRHVVNLGVEKRSDDIINTVFFTGGDTGGGVILYKKYADNASVNLFGIRAVRYVDERVTSATTAQILSNNVIQASNSPEIRLDAEIADSNLNTNGYDIEAIQVGDIINIRNTQGNTGSSLWDVAVWDLDKWDYDITQIGTMYLQVIRKEYTPDSLRVFCSSLPPDVNKRVEDIKRNLENSQTVNNPSSPT